MKFERLENRCLLSAMSLLEVADADTVSVASGDWHDPTIWSNGIPTATDDAYVQSDHAITIKQNADADVLKIDGQLWFDPAADITFTVDTILVDIGGMYVQGTESEPVTGEHNVIYRDAGAIDTVWDVNMVSRGLISSGTVEIHGTAKTSHAKAEEALATDSAIWLRDPVAGWEVGDQILIVGTNRENGTSVDDELRTIVDIDFGRYIELDSPLSYDHTTPALTTLGGLKPFAYDVANLTRSVTFASANTTDHTRAGHTMFTTPEVDIRYAAFEHLGRNDKTIPTTDPDGLGGGLGNPRGRYSLHWHKNDQGVNSNIEGSVVMHSPGWGFVNHDSNVDMRNNVGYAVTGAHFVTETGPERGTIENNLAVYSEGIPTGQWRYLNRHDGTDQGNKNGFGHAGHGFWMQSPRVTMLNNTAASTANEAFVMHGMIEPSDPNPDGNQPIFEGELQGFEAYAAGAGFSIMWHRPYAPLDTERDVLSGFQLWENGLAGITLRYTTGVTLKDGIVHGDFQKGQWWIDNNLDPDENEQFNARGFSSNFNSGYIGLKDFAFEGFEIGIQAPLNGTTVIDDVTIDADIAHIWAPTPRGGMDARIVADNPTVYEEDHEQHITATDITFTGSGDKWDFVTDLTDGQNFAGHHNAQLKMDTYLLPHRYYLNGQQLWRYEQAAFAVPFPNTMPQSIKDAYPEYIDQTMQQLSDAGLGVLGDDIAPATAIDQSASGINGLGV